MALEREEIGVAVDTDAEQVVLRTRAVAAVDRPQALLHARERQTLGPMVSSKPIDFARLVEKIEAILARRS